MPICRWLSSLQQDHREERRDNPKTQPAPELRRGAGRDELEQEECKVLVPRHTHKALGPHPRPLQAALQASLGLHLDPSEVGAMTLAQTWATRCSSRLPSTTY